MAGLGWALALVVLVNSSLQMRVPEAMLVETDWETMALSVSPERWPMALTETLAATRKGAMYCVAVVPGVLPSRV